MKQIAILSDTHGLLREFVINEIAAADCSIHAGDINTPYIIETIQQLGETYMRYVVTMIKNGQRTCLKVLLSLLKA